MSEEEIGEAPGSPTQRGTVAAHVLTHTCFDSRQSHNLPLQFFLSEIIIHPCLRKKRRGRVERWKMTNDPLVSQLPTVSHHQNE
jgi:hypothetical protein